MSMEIIRPYLCLLVMLNKLFGGESVKIAQFRLHHDGHQAHRLLDDAFGDAIN